MINKEKILILSAGGSPEPLYYSINFIQPDKIVFLPSPQTYHTCADVLDNSDWNNEIPYKDEISESVKSFHEESDAFLKSFNSDKNEYDKIKGLSQSQIESLSSYNKLMDLLSKTMYDITETDNISDKSIFYSIISDAELLDESYKAAKGVISIFNDEELYDVIIDFTGGTKTMGAGVTLAAITENNSNIELRYVGSKDSESRTKNGIGIIKDGSEFSKFQENPILKFAEFEFNRGKNFFNKYQFKAAKENFELAKERTEDKKLKSLAKLYLNIVKFYDAWDKFEEKVPGEDRLVRFYEYKIKISLKNNPELLDELNKNPNFYDIFKENIKFLEKKLPRNKKKLVNDIDYYLPDLLNNAKRRIDEGKYDDAVARLYRAIELIAQLLLKDLGILHETEINKKVFSINKEKINNLALERNIDISDIKDYHEYKKKKRNGKYSPTFKVPLYKSYEILKTFNDPIAIKYFGDNDIQDNVYSRNGSILAHGLNPIGYDKADKLYKLVLDYARKYNPNIDELMKKSEFPKFYVN